ncbi:hypothetical protein GW17_00057646 [Ensete ventricosum]|nr:hypothetical protein GW17_00057646 [Ensete ventricosum]
MLIGRYGPYRLIGKQRVKARSLSPRSRGYERNARGTARSGTSTRLPLEAVVCLLCSLAARGFLESAVGFWIPGEVEDRKPRISFLKTLKIKVCNFDLYYPERAVHTGTRTTRYWAVPPKIDCRRSIEEEIDHRRLIEREIDRRRSIEEEKGKKKRKRKKKEEEKKEYLARAPSSAVFAPGERSRRHKFKSDLMKIAMTTLSSKILSQDKEQFAKLAVDAVLRLKVSRIS